MINKCATSLKRNYNKVRAMHIHKIESADNNSELITCPICKATIDLMSQDLKSESNFYFCANCGLVLPKLKN